MFGRKAKKKMVVRIAPSPTGHLHVGTARSALFNFLLARKHGGTFIVRSEDTDSERSKRVFEDEILEGLHWLGITWDDFYRQSDRTNIYRGYLEKMIENKVAYLSKEESKRAPGTTIEVVRLKNPNKTITFDDIVRGEVSFDTTELGDFVIARSLDDALYHFTVVVDDHEMGITHVVRGEDHISNTPRQILIQEAIGAERPQYAHLPLLLAPDKSKLSKRNGTVMLSEYRDQGFLPVAVTNYLALLGWNPGTDQELFTLEELIKEFDLEGVQKGGAIFNIEKLRWFNREHLLKMDENAFSSYALPWLLPHLESKSQFSTERANRLMPIIRERIHVGSDIKDAAESGEYDFAVEQPMVSLEMLKWKNDGSVKDTLPRLRHTAEIISTLPEDTTVEAIQDSLMPYAEEVGKGQVLWPLRVALTGKERSPDPFTVVHVIGAAEAYQRVKRACDTILSA